MKKKLLILTVLLAAAAWLSLAHAQTKRNRATKEFMRDKLELSQRVLEGLATEDYDLIITKGGKLGAMSKEADWRVFENPDYDLIIAKGAKLGAMSKEADWRVFENPDYDQQSVVFRRHVDSLVKAAKDKNLDAATLAYVRMTMSCVDCHKLVRGKLVASADGLHPTTLAGRSTRD